jgi:hypothetical protein
MKKSIYTLSLIALTTGTFTTSCNSSAEKVDEAKANVVVAAQDLDQAKANYDEEYAKFKLESDQKITANEKRIAELKADTKKVKKETKEQYEKTIAALEEKNNLMKKKISEYKEEGDEKWQSFKREFNHDMDELCQALTDLTKNNTN